MECFSLSLRWALQLATLVLFTADLDVPSDRAGAVRVRESSLSDAKSFVGGR